MKEINAVFTGEMSGHMFFADDYYGFDDALYAGARLLELLSHSEKNISEMLSDVPRYYSTPEIRIPVGDEEKFFIVDKVREYFKLKYPLIVIDGARILFPQGWGLVRASNTGPELIVRCEGNSPEALEQIKAELFGYLQSLGMDDESSPAEFSFTPVYNYPKSEFQDRIVNCLLREDLNKYLCLIKECRVMILLNLGTYPQTMWYRHLFHGFTQQPVNQW